MKTESTPSAETVPGLSSMELLALVTDKPLPAFRFFEFDWQWQRVHQIAEGLHCLPAKLAVADPMLNLAFHFIKDLRRYQEGSVSNEPVSTTDPDMASAHATWSDPACVRVRSILEALVLAGASPELMAEKCKLTSQAVALYERFFFDIRPLLQYQPWMLVHLQGRLRHSKGNAEGILLRYIGYCLGPEMVCQLCNPGATLTPEQSAALSNFLRRTVEQDVLEEVVAMQPTLQNVVKLMRTYLAHDEDGAREPVPPDTADAFAETMPAPEWVQEIVKKVYHRPPRETSNLKQ